MAVVNKLLDVLSALPGMSHAEPGEFSRRAVLNQRMGITQVEAVADLVNAETDAQRRQALRMMGLRLLYFFVVGCHKIDTTYNMLIFNAVCRQAIKR